jgi:hypothetical protein
VLDRVGRALLRAAAAHARRVVHRVARRAGEQRRDVREERFAGRAVALGPRARGGGVELACRELGGRLRRGACCGGVS